MARKRSRSKKVHHCKTVHVPRQGKRKICWSHKGSIVSNTKAC